MSSSASVSIGVGFDTARYGHHVSFLRADLQPAAKAFTFAESPTGYAQLRRAFEQIHNKYGDVHFTIRIDAAGQYAVNLELFLRGLDLPMTISVGEPKRNKDYQKAHSEFVLGQKAYDDATKRAQAAWNAATGP